MQGRTIGHILWCAAAPDKVAWVWNSLIIRRSLPKEWLTLLPSGTASNESLHAELNNWWRNSPECYSTTLDLHLQVGQLAKMLSHNSALYCPTLRQVPQDQVLALALQGITFDDASWSSWGEHGIKASVPLFEAREELAGRLAASSSGAVHHVTTFVVQKKPSQKKPAGSIEVIKKVKAGKKVSTEPKPHKT